MRTAAIIPMLVLGFTLFHPEKVAAQDYASWIRYSNRGDNQLIVEMLRQGDLSEALEIATAVGLREDAEIQEIVLAVGETVDPRPQWERELILRVLLASVFPDSLGSVELEAGLHKNRAGIDFLVDGLPGFSLSLQREVIRLLGYFHPPEYSSALMAEGRRLADLLRLQRGELNGEQAGLTLTYLQTLERVGNPDFADLVLLIVERSRHLEVAEAARSASRSLLLTE
jgi:hypothetical protein